MELCTRRILVQNEQIELTWVYLYPFNADVSRNTNYGHNHYLVPFLKPRSSFACVLSKRKGKQIQDGGTFLFKITLFFTYIYHFNFLIYLKFSKEEEEEEEEKDEEEEEEVNSQFNTDLYSTGAYRAQKAHLHIQN